MKTKRDLYHLIFVLPEEFYISKECGETISMKFNTLKQLDKYTMKFNDLTKLAEDFLSKTLDTNNQRIEGTYINKSTVVDFFKSRNLDLGKNIKFVKTVVKGKIEIKSCILLKYDKKIINNNGTMIENIRGFAERPEKFGNFGKKASEALRTGFIGELVYPALEKIKVTNVQHREEIKKNIIKNALEYKLSDKIIEDLLKKYGYSENIDYVSYVLMSRFNESKDYRNGTNAAYKENHADYLTEMAGFYGGTPKYSIIRRYYEYMRYYCHSFIIESENKKNSGKGKSKEHLLYELAPDKTKYINKIRDLERKIDKRTMPGEKKDPIDVMIDKLFNDIAKRNEETKTIEDLKDAPNFVKEVEIPRISEREKAIKEEKERLKAKKDEIEKKKFEKKYPNHNKEQAAIDELVNEFFDKINNNKPEIINPDGKIR